MVSSGSGADHHTILASWLQDGMQSALEGEEVHFLQAGNFLAELEAIITKRSASTASVFSINAMIPAATVAAAQPSCTAPDIVPFLAKLVRWVLGPSGLILRVGPGMLVCIHLSHRSVDPELIGLQVERSIKRIFKIPIETEGILKESFCFDPRISESEETLIRFISSL